MQIDGLLELHQCQVRPEWIDYNGHMNVAYYVLAFDHATDALLDALGMGERYRHEHDASVFTAEAHVTYERELKLGDPIRFQTQLLGYDAKRVHYFHTMYHGVEGFLAATNELMILHVDMTARKVAPMPEFALGRLEQIDRVHRRLVRPPQVGRVMGFDQPKA